jgi:hypothetical protein
MKRCHCREDVHSIISPASDPKGKCAKVWKLDCLIARQTVTHMVAAGSL